MTDKGAFINIDAISLGFVEFQARFAFTGKGAIIVDAVVVNTAVVCADGAFVDVVAASVYHFVSFNSLASVKFDAEGSEAFHAKLTVPVSVVGHSCVVSVWPTIVARTSG